MSTRIVRTSLIVNTPRTRRAYDAGTRDAQSGHTYEYAFDRWNRRVWSHEDFTADETDAYDAAWDDTDTREPAPVEAPEPAPAVTPNNRTAAKGDRFTLDGKTFTVYLVSPAGSGGTSYAHGPQIGAWLRPGGYGVSIDEGASGVAWLPREVDGAEAPAAPLSPVESARKFASERVGFVPVSLAASEPAKA